MMNVRKLQAQGVSPGLGWGAALQGPCSTALPTVEVTPRRRGRFQLASGHKA